MNNLTSHEQQKLNQKQERAEGSTFFLQKGHGRVLKTILIWIYHSQGLFWGTDLHRSTNQLQFQSKAVQVSDWKYHWDLKLNTQDYIELGVWTVSCSHTFHHYDPHLYLNKVMPSNLRKKKTKNKNMSHKRRKCLHISQYPVEIIEPDLVIHPIQGYFDSHTMAGGHSTGEWLT